MVELCVFDVLLTQSNKIDKMLCNMVTQSLKAKPMGFTMTSHSIQHAVITIGLTVNDMYVSLIEMTNVCQCISVK